MAATQDHEDEASTPDESVAALQSSPDRTVFTEADNPDGWISTDHTVELER
jgi:hypothetical protein